MKIVLEPAWLAVHFEKPYECLSWAVCGGGLQVSRQVLWHKVRNEDLLPAVDPETYLQTKLDDKHFPDAVAMLTSADLSHYQDVIKREDDLKVRCLATVGMSNALRIGDPPATIQTVGTINLLCVVSKPLSQSGMIEALSLAAEARTAAVMDAKLPSTQTGLPSTGTGTDCAVLACPLISDERKERYAGKHTRLGSLIGSAVYSAVEAGLQVWKQNHLKKEVFV